MTNTALTPIQKLRADYDAPEDEFCVIVSDSEIDEFKEYIKELIYDPQVACVKVKRLLLLYVAIVNYIVISFDVHRYMDIEMIKSCDELAKVLYTFYKDVNTMLYTKKIESLWKAYIKLCEAAKKVPESSNHKIESSRDRILADLESVMRRIKGI